MNYQRGLKAAATLFLTGAKPTDPGVDPGVENHLLPCFLLYPLASSMKISSAESRSTGTPSK
jgi:hypothetical protein